MTFAKVYFDHFTMAQNLEFCLRLVVAFVVGGLIGLERSNRFKEAGVRTHIMVCCTTALIMLISKYGFADLGPADTMEYFGSKGGGYGEDRCAGGQRYLFPVRGRDHQSRRKHQGADDGSGNLDDGGNRSGDRSGDVRCDWVRTGTHLAAAVRDLSHSARRRFL